MCRALSLVDMSNSFRLDRHRHPRWYTLPADASKKSPSKMAGQWKAYLSLSSTSMDFRMVSDFANQASSPENMDRSHGKYHSSVTDSAVMKVSEILWLTELAPGPPFSHIVSGLSCGFSFASKNHQKICWSVPISEYPAKLFTLGFGSHIPWGTLLYRTFTPAAPFVVLKPVGG